MAKRPLTSFSALFFNGDWHTELVSSLKLAKDETRSNEIRTAIEALENLLATTDECIHTVTVTQEVPVGLDVDMVMSHVQEQIVGEAASVELKEPETIELTLTARGNRNHVKFTATALLANGISEAKAKVWVRLVFGGDKHDVR